MVYISGADPGIFSEGSYTIKFGFEKTGPTIELGFQKKGWVHIQNALFLPYFGNFVF
jgi:hypothetical protein